MGVKHGEFRELITEMFRERHKKPHLTVNLLRQHWEDILGQELARKTYPARITGHTLWINALDASWAYQLQFMKHELLESVQVFMGTRDIRELRFKQGSLHAGAGNADTENADNPHTSQENSVNNSAASAQREEPTAQRVESTAQREESTAQRQEETARQEESTAQAAKVISDDSLRDSFHRWARVKKRINPSSR